MDDDLSTFIAMVLATGGMFIVGFALGSDNSKSITRTDTVIFCSEKPKECKIEYDYLKYQKSRDSIR